MHKVQFELTEPICSCEQMKYSWRISELSVTLECPTCQVSMTTPWKQLAGWISVTPKAKPKPQVETPLPDNVVRLRF